jgi:hypothetical protein
MMLHDLELILDAIGEAPLDGAAVQRLIVTENLLGRPTMSARRKAARLLSELYGLDDAVPLFVALRRLWALDEVARPALALQLAAARDAFLRGAMPFVSSLAPAEPFAPAKLVDFLGRRYAGRYSVASLRSAARNVASTWAQVGVLRGSVRKVRGSLAPRPASVAFALFLGWLEGARGTLLFETPWARLFDVDSATVREFAVEAGRQGMLRIAAIGEVVEVSFNDWPGARGRRESNRSAA